MNDLKWLESNSIEAKNLLKKRGGSYDIDGILALFKERRAGILALENLKAQKNQINELLKRADKNEIESKKHEMRALSADIKDKERNLMAIEEKLAALSLTLPNFPRYDVPEGKDASDNVIVKVIGEKTKFNFKPRDHVELGAMTNTIDFARAAKISGARFVFLQGACAQLNRALMQFYCDLHVEQGDIELSVPFMVHEQAMIATGQFPKFMDQAFKVVKEDGEPYFLIPTAEAPVTNYFADEIIDEEELPIRFCAYSPCFRSEAGASGQDTRGLIRMHQFEKVEMVRFARAEDAMKELDLMVERASKLLSLLELPHRIVELCGGDLSFQAEKTFDLEVYLPGQDCYREISSCSSFGSFQARRAKIRMRKEGKIEPLVTLNGSGLPLGRTIVAIYENHQNQDGSINVPRVLRPYMRGAEIIKLA
jgi:seryl-tRNA synthetase